MVCNRTGWGLACAALGCQRCLFFLQASEVSVSRNEWQTLVGLTLVRRVERKRLINTCSNEYDNSIQMLTTLSIYFMGKYVTMKCKSTYERTVLVLNNIELTVKIKL
mmetsp:Transcript_2497/g.6530  ORF Transcript_2497/g.6530 Transcript_2497/m.6530 type:complete len:107 (+) Transcript_2497:1512-1832(+)